MARYQQGSAIRRIAADLGSSYSTIRQILIMTNTPLRKRGKRSPRFRGMTATDNPA